MNYMHCVGLKKVNYKATETNDHQHCAFCMGKFGESDDWMRSGYCPLNGYHWVCEACFRDFQEQFAWSLTEN